MNSPKSVDFLFHDGRSVAKSDTIAATTRNTTSIILGRTMDTNNNTSLGRQLRGRRCPNGTHVNFSRELSTGVMTKPLATRPTTHNVNGIVMVAVVLQRIYRRTISCSFMHWERVSHELGSGACSPLCLKKSPALGSVEDVSGASSSGGNGGFSGASIGGGSTSSVSGSSGAGSFGTGGVSHGSIGNSYTADATQEIQSEKEEAARIEAAAYAESASNSCQDENTREEAYKQYTRKMAGGGSGAVGKMATVAAYRDAYQVLGLSRDSPAKDIKHAYVYRAMHAHPDRAGKSKDTHTCQADWPTVVEAYMNLKDPHTRRHYDKHLGVRHVVRQFYTVHNASKANETDLDTALSGHQSLHGDEIADYAEPLLRKLQRRYQVPNFPLFDQFLAEVKSRRKCDSDGRG
jgi:hypothetical protein